LSVVPHDYCAARITKLDIVLQTHLFWVKGQRARSRSTKTIAGMGHGTLMASSNCLPVSNGEMRYSEHWLCYSAACSCAYWSHARFL